MIIRVGWVRLAIAVGMLGASLESAARGQLAVQRITTGTAKFSGPIFGVSAPGDPDRLYVVEQGGQIRFIDTTSPAATPQPFLSLTNANFPSSNLTTGGEQGLLGLAFHPDYQSNGLFYTYSTANSGNDLRVDQFRSVNGVVQTGLRRTVLSIPHPTNTNHNGGWIGFSPTGGTALYVATGDGGGGNDPANNSQSTGSLLGKMLRIDVGATGLPFDGQTGGYTIPAGNMTVNPNGNLTSPAPPTTTVRPEIYAYGLRNPWRNSFDRLTGDLYIGDVGQGERVGSAGLGVEHAERDVVDAFGDRVDVGGGQDVAVCVCLGKRVGGHGSPRGCSCQEYRIRSIRG